jgi:hypothetical protein
MNLKTDTPTPCYKDGTDMFQCVSETYAGCMANVEYYMALAQNHNELSKTYANKVTFFLGMAQEHNENDYQYDNEQTTPKA